MKKLLAFSAFAIAGLVAYYAVNKRSRQVAGTAPATHPFKEHHITNVFSKAKQHAVEKQE